MGESRNGLAPNQSFLNEMLTCGFTQVTKTIDEDVNNDFYIPIHPNLTKNKHAIEAMRRYLWNNRVPLAFLFTRRYDL